jgi:hypothetical protein
MADPTNDPSADMTSYASNSALFKTTGASLPGSFGAKGTSNTVMLMERYARAPVGLIGPLALLAHVHHWSMAYTALDCSTPGAGFSNFPQFAPPANQADNRTPQGFLPTVMLVGLGDGSVRVIPPGMNPSTWNWACNPDATDVPADW